MSSGEQRSITVISRDEGFKGIVAELLGNSYELVNFPDIQTSIDYIYNSLPSLVVIHLLKDDRLSPSILKAFKSDPIFSQLPVLGVLEDGYVIPSWDYCSWTTSRGASTWWRNSRCARTCASSAPNAWWT